MGLDFAASAVVDTINNPSPMAEATAIFVLAAAVVATMTGVVALVHKVYKLTRGLSAAARQFFEDWNGQEARPGHDRVPGVPEQLSVMQAEQQRVAKELRTNGGSSVKDATIRMERELGRQAVVLNTLVGALGSYVSDSQKKGLAEAEERTAAHAEGEALWQAVEAISNTEPPQET